MSTLKPDLISVSHFSKSTNNSHLGWNQRIRWMRKQFVAQFIKFRYSNNTLGHSCIVLVCLWPNVDVFFLQVFVELIQKIDTIFAIECSMMLEEIDVDYTAWSFKKLSPWLCWFSEPSWPCDQLRMNAAPNIRITLSYLRDHWESKTPVHMIYLWRSQFREPSISDRLMPYYRFFNYV